MDDLLNKLYFGKAGFQSQQNLYKEAKAINKTITLKYVKEWYNKNIDKTRYYGAKNSFVAPGANYEYQIDLFFITDLENQVYKIGMACIDIFTKYATVVPIRSKQPADYLAGLMECLKNMKQKPKFIFSDNEGSLNSTDVLGYLKKQNIDVITTRSHARFIERFIRTFKMMLRKRIDNDLKQGYKNIQWHNYIYPVMLTYNNKKEHSTIEMKPSEAIKEDNQLMAKMNIISKAKRGSMYPPLEVGNKVKILLKYDKFHKEHMPKFSDNKYEVEKIEEVKGLKFYIVNGRPRLRNEILKV